MVRTFRGAAPRVHPAAWVHDSAELIGAVRIGREASIWPGAVLRGDVERIVVGEATNVQDLCVFHGRERRPVLLGRGITVGHRVVLHGCRVGDGSLIGMGSVVMEAEIGRECLVAAGSLVLAGMRFAPRSLVLGSPAHAARTLTAAELRGLRASARSYVQLARSHRRTSAPVFPA